ncbi:uncharacterized protein DUF3106 [Sulfuritortus calidifontis]|uniref:Uncharacterized protein DUF3106 n=1 Tax=Sulfuritortus calidifontis TaxID=1914471 RepID=A0A4R3JWG1_9PROT|nr:DUF3106 domain-containing protein [Sulfuritortus calidifontis]TCS72605.1 uncharacterized protein DUF3106 [Sulfuritortus calidifontis]
MKPFSRLGLLLCLGLMAGPALAERPHDGEDSVRQGRLWLAQMTPEQRERLRERWERTSPEERAAIRRELRERVQNIPPEQREQVRNRLIERMQPARQERERPQEAEPPRNGFGQGFEHRRERMDWSDPGADRPGGRGRQR